MCVLARVCSDLPILDGKNESYRNTLGKLFMYYLYTNFLRLIYMVPMFVSPQHMILRITRHENFNLPFNYTIVIRIFVELFLRTF